MRASVRGGVALVLVLSVAAAALVWSQSRQREESALVELVRAAEIELARDPVDRSGGQAALRRLRSHARADEEPRLIRAAAALELALGRVQVAYDTIARLAMEPQAAPEDLSLGARVLLRLYGERGESELAVRAFELAERRTRTNSGPDDWLLAWQSARRGGLVDEADRMAQELGQAHPGSPPAKLVKALHEQAPLAELRSLEQDFARVPLELDFAVAVLLVEGATVDAVPEAVTRLERVLVEFPASVDARSAAAVAQHRLGQREARDACLDWLLRNADTDPRREGWAQLRARPAGEGH